MRKIDTSASMLQYDVVMMVDSRALGINRAIFEVNFSERQICTNQNSVCYLWEFCLFFVGVLD